ncbi:sodium- and chloride-dependent glycine transporter 1-like [Saccostrea echinata]|uniref:sodium- and chloride-dependent glycine transporter 1-like n=1 Tax=Saccostrea echinata TaxID=191078 RepID=UPI002A81A5DA|nr:sodium- and chloride-dependent glycine transporter 1-like [Saccostrea echinata]
MPECPLTGLSTFHFIFPQAKRAAWSNQIEFVLTLIGYAVGLGNVWRFPYLAYKNGGGAFLIPYFVSLVLIGIPLFFLELSFGQFASLGPIRIWVVNPAFKGLGFAMTIISALIALYYNVVIAWCLYYLFASMTSYLPWQDCENEWNTCKCIDKTRNFSSPDPWNGKRPECLSQLPDIVNATKRTPSDEYFTQKVLGITDSWTDPGGVKWDVTLCNLLAWLIVFLVLSKGIKSLGKVVYFTAIFPYILLTVLLVRGLTLSGSHEGVMYYLTPDWNKLLQASVWSDAAVQIFYSLSACSGGLIAMASYNKFNNNVLRDSLVVPFINCLTSFYAGFVIFSVLGFMADYKGVTMDNVVKGGPGLTFVVYPEALAQMQVAPLWAILFFFMMATLGFSSQFSITETVITGIVDEFPHFFTNKKRLILFRAGICGTAFLLGLPMTCRGGEYTLNLMDTFVGGFPLLFVGLFEIIAIIYIYGFFRFKRDIEMMLGSNIVINIFFGYFATMWLLISPLALLAVIIFKAVQTKPATDGSYVYPDFGQALGWLMVLAPLIWIPVIFFFEAFRNGLGRLLVKITSPEKNWGPALPENQVGRYSEENKARSQKINGTNGYIKSSLSDQSQPPMEKYTPLQTTFVKPNTEIIPNGRPEQHTVDIDQGTGQNGQTSDKGVVENGTAKVQEVVENGTAKVQEVVENGTAKVEPQKPNVQFSNPAFENDETKE